MKTFSFYRDTQFICSLWWQLVTTSVGFMALFQQKKNPQNLLTTV